MSVRNNSGAALLLLGTQNEFLNADGFFLRNNLLTLSHDGRGRLVTNVNRIADAARRADRPVIHGYWSFRPDYLDCNFSVQSRRFGLQEQAAFVRGTLGAALSDEVTVGHDDFLLPLVSHSAFQFTPLDRLLRNCGVEACVVVGGLAHESVDDTVRQGAAFGYRMLLVPDAIFPLESQHLATLATRAEAISVEDALELVGGVALPLGQ